MAIIDLTGKIFTRLRVIRLAGKDKHNSALWLCKCECGNEKIVPSQPLRRGATKSCGCYNNDRMAKLGRSNKGKKPGLRHGMGGRRDRAPEYKVWDAMIQRCTNPDHPSFQDYGARGISVCEKWMDFEAFIADVGKRPSAKHSLDRFPNNDGNYEPGNCRWATMKQQAVNKRTNFIVTAFGRTGALSTFIKEGGKSKIYKMAYNRIRYKGWDAERAIKFAYESA